VLLGAIGALAGALAGRLGLALALGVVVGVAASAVAWWRADAVVLRASGARPAEPAVHARLHNLVEGLCSTAGLSVPRLLVVDDAAPNALAVGRDPRHASLVVTTGLLDRLGRVELEGVLAHELSHVKAHDTLVSGLAATVAGGTTLVGEACLRAGRWGRVPGRLLLVASPLAGRAVRASVSRTREAVADAAGVTLTRYPPGLARALVILAGDRSVLRSASRATAHLWIESPLGGLDSQGRRSGHDHLFDTHPPLEERIQALRAL
jgi:heat shock protein HtpX